MSALGDFLESLFVPLSFLPLSVTVFLSTVAGFFKLFVFGKVLRWLWDVLPGV